MHRHRADGPPFLPGSLLPARFRSDTDTLEFEELAPFVLDDTVTDVLVQGGVSVWVDRGTGLVDTGLRLAEPRTRELATRLVALGGRHVDESKPTF
jgi:pilus assembly protein CpaF